MNHRRRSFQAHSDGGGDAERGSITSFVAVVAVSLVLVAGMAYDGGQVVTGHATARSYADKAARAGAQAIDIDELRATGRVVLDPSGAARAAEQYLNQVGASGSAVVDGGDVTVTVTIVVPMRILPGPDRSITAVETATASTGPP